MMTFRVDHRVGGCWGDRVATRRLEVHVTPCLRPCDTWVNVLA
jgi:hypothetical protein